MSNFIPDIINSNDTSQNTYNPYMNSSNFRSVFNPINNNYIDSGYNPYAIDVND